MSDEPVTSRRRVGLDAPGLGEKAEVPTAPPATGTATVTVGCKWPNGLIMQLFRMEEQVREVNGVTIRERIAVRDPGEPQYVLNGFSIDLGAMAGGIPPEHQIVGGFGLTHGIPADFAEAWFSQNQQNDLVKNGLVFMASSEQRARAYARDHSAVKCGIEPIDPTNPAPRAGLRAGTIRRESAPMSAE